MAAGNDMPFGFEEASLKSSYAGKASGGLHLTTVELM